MDTLKNRIFLFLKLTLKIVKLQAAEFVSLKSSLLTFSYTAGNFPFEFSISIFSPFFL